MSLGGDTQGTALRLHTPVSLHQAGFLPSPALNSIQDIFLFYVHKTKILFFPSLQLSFCPLETPVKTALVAKPRVDLRPCALHTGSAFHTTNGFAQGEKYVFSL